MTKILKSQSYIKEKYQTNPLIKENLKGINLTTNDVIFNVKKNAIWRDNIVQDIKDYIHITIKVILSCEIPNITKERRMLVKIPVFIKYDTTKKQRFGWFEYELGKDGDVTFEVLDINDKDERDMAYNLVKACYSKKVDNEISSSILDSFDLKDTFFFKNSIYMWFDHFEKNNEKPDEETCTTIVNDCVKLASDLIVKELNK